MIFFKYGKSHTSYLKRNWNPKIHREADMIPPRGYWIRRSITPGQKGLKIWSSALKNGEITQTRKIATNGKLIQTNWIDPFGRLPIFIQCIGAPCQPLKMAKRPKVADQRPKIARWQACLCLSQNIWMALIGAQTILIHGTIRSREGNSSE